MATSYVKTPDGAVHAVDKDGFISKVVLISLSEVFASLDYEGFLDLLSVRATGSSCLSDISYQLIGTDGDSIKIAIRGSIGAMPEVQQLRADQLSAREFQVDVVRIGCGHRTIRVNAITPDEARHAAIDNAGNHVFDEHVSDYEAWVLA